MDRWDEKHHAQTLTLNRRQFIISGITAGGGLLIGVPLSSNIAADSPERAHHANNQIGFFIEILNDNRVVNWHQST